MAFRGTGGKGAGTKEKIKHKGVTWDVSQNPKNKSVDRGR